MRDIARKVAVAIALPLSASLVLAVLLGVQSWQTVQRARTVEHLASFVIKINHLAHALQEERGIVTAALADVPGFAGQIEEARERTDRQVLRVERWLRQNEGADAQSAVALADGALSRIPHARALADAEPASVLSGVTAYFEIVDRLIEAADALALGSPLPGMSERIAVFQRLMLFKDFAARERALGAALLGVPSAQLTLHNDYLNNLYAQRAMRRELEDSGVGSIDRAVHDELAAQPYLPELERYRARIVDLRQLNDADPAAASTWFALASERLRHLRDLLDRHANDFGARSRRIADREYTRFVALVGGVALMVGALAWASARVGRRLVWQMEVEQRDAERIQYLGRHDPLTGLPNRYYFEELVENTRRSAVENGRMLALHLLDVVDFREVNRIWGIAVGDEVVNQVASRIVRCTPADGVVARLYGDEFGVVQSSVRSLDEAEQHARCLLDLFKAPIEIGDRRIPLRIRVGCTLYPPDAETYDVLMRNADLARQEVETREGSGYRFYVSAMYQRYQAARELHAELKDAVAGEQFDLLYQPKVDLATGRTAAVEALIRWRHPQRGLLLPGEFIPEAERSGHIVPIGLWAFAEACRQVKAWQAAGLEVPTVSVNLSVVQLHQAGLVEELRGIVREVGVDPAHLELEITESMVMEDLRASLRVLQQLRATGFSLSIDDFGTGYSSLTYLKQFPVNVLKLDKSFVTDIETANESKAIVDAVIWLAHGLAMRVVAEGVETQGQLEILKRQGCDQVQGFVFAPPLAAHEAAHWF